MATARTICNDAVKLIGAYERGRSLSDTDGAEGLRRLNQMIEGLNNKYLAAYQRIQRTQALTEGTASYTIGSGGDINTTRPLRIESAFTRDSDNNDRMLDIISNDEWTKISRKGQYNSFPRKMYYRPAYPLATINLEPAPSASLTLYLECTAQIATYAGLSTSTSLPPGYERMLTYNLAVEWAPYYEREAPETVKRIATESLADIMDTNNNEIPILETPFSPSVTDKYDGLFDLGW